MAMKVRPTGVSILAAAFIILGIYYFIWFLFLFGISILGESESVFYQSMLGSDTLSALLAMITTAVMVATGIGLLGMKKWAWYLSFLALVLMMVHIIFGHSDSTTIWALVQLTVTAIFAYILLQKETRQVFEIG
jgi:hypothetical protein